MKATLLSLLSFFFFTSFIFSQTFQWQKLNGPFGGTPLCFVSKGSERFVGMDQNQGGVFRSSDDETAWGQESSGIALADRAISWLAVDDSGYIVAGTNSHIGAGVYKSKDNGENWVNIANLGGNSVAKNDSGHLYVGNTGYGQYSVSKDGGYIWTHFSHTSPFINCIEINDSNHIFIGGNYTGYRSTDNGATWTNLPLPDGINSFAFAPNGDVYAGCSREYAYESGVYKSTNNGDSWTPVKQGIRVYATHNIAINDDGDIFVGSYGWGIWRSTDDGATWTQQNSGLHHFQIKSLYILNDGNIYAGAAGGGIYRSSDNGESWQQVGLTVAGVYKIAISPTNENLFAAVNGMARSSDDGQTWVPINNGLTNYGVQTVAIKNDGTIFAGCTSDGSLTCVYRSTDNGNSWIASDAGIQRQSVFDLSFDTSGNIYLGNYYGVYKSADNGNGWKKIGDISGVNGARGIKFNSTGDLFLATYGNGLWKLPAGDTTWVNLTSNYGYNWIYTLFIGSNDYLYTDGKRSTDNGLTWETMPLGNMAYSYAENSQGHLFAGTFNYGSGVKRSTNYGESWESINSGLPTQDVRCVAVDADDYLYAGPWGYSLYKTTTSTITSVETEKNLPTSFYLEQNYPNPFNPSTKIKYTVPSSVILNRSSRAESRDEGSLVTLKVFDVLGNKIATLVDEYKPAGNYEVEFNEAHESIRAMASGIYFYQLQSGSFVQTKKMVYLK